MTSEEYEILKEQMRTRLETVQSDIQNALSLCGRSSGSLTLIGVSKYFPAEYAEAAFSLGLKNLGENRVQELLSKKEHLDALGIHPNWHLIGTLQTNKVRQIVGHTALIHSVSSEDLLLEIQKRSQAIGRNTSILLQVNISQEDSKHGFEASEIEKAIEIAGNCPAVSLCGLMTMAPIQTEQHDALPVFQKTKELFEELRSKVKDPLAWNVLSMGMSQDYIDAIQCGSTHIRIGTAIFGHRS